MGAARIAQMSLKKTTFYNRRCIQWLSTKVKAQLLNRCNYCSNTHKDTYFQRWK